MKIIDFVVSSPRLKSVHLFINFIIDIKKNSNPLCVLAWRTACCWTCWWCACSSPWWRMFTRLTWPSSPTLSTPPSRGSSSKHPACRTSCPGSWRPYSSTSTHWTPGSCGFGSTALSAFLLVFPFPPPPPPPPHPPGQQTYCNNVADPLLFVSSRTCLKIPIWIIVAALIIRILF